MSIKAVINIAYPINNEDMETYLKGLEVFVFSQRNQSIDLINQCTLSGVDLVSVDSFYINFPLRMLNFRIINCPNLDKAKLREIIPLELESLILTKKEDLVFDFISERTPEGTLKVLVAYLDKGIINALLNLLKEKGIIPLAMICCQIRSVLPSGIDNFAQNIMALREDARDDLVPLLKEELIAPTIKITDKEFSLTELRDNLFKPLYKASIFVLVLLIIITLWLIFKIFTSYTERTTLTKEIRSRYMTLFPEDKKITDEVYQLKSKLKTLKDKEDAIIGISGLDILKRLSDAKKEGISLHELTLNKDSINMKGDAASMDEIERFKKDLTWIKGLTISNVHQTDKGMFAFSASGRLADGF